MWFGILVGMFVWSLIYLISDRDNPTYNFTHLVVRYANLLILFSSFFGAIGWIIEVAI